MQQEKRNIVQLVAYKIICADTVAYGTGRDAFENFRESGRESARQKRIQLTSEFIECIS